MSVYNFGSKIEGITTLKSIVDSVLGSVNGVSESMFSFRQLLCCTLYAVRGDNVTS